MGYKAYTPSNFIRPPRMEKEIQKAVMEFLYLKKLMVWRANTGASFYPYVRGGAKPRFVRFGIPGQSDIMGVLPGGRFLALEVKRPGYIPTRAQQAFLLRVQSLGGVAAIVSDVDDVARILEEEGVR